MCKLLRTIFYLYISLSIFYYFIYVIYYVYINILCQQVFYMLFSEQKQKEIMYHTVGESVNNFVSTTMLLYLIFSLYIQYMYNDNEK